MDPTLIHVPPLDLGYLDQQIAPNLPSNQPVARPEVDSDINSNQITWQFIKSHQRLPVLPWLSV